MGEGESVTHVTHLPIEGLSEKSVRASIGKCVTVGHVRHTFASKSQAANRWANNFEL